MSTSRQPPQTELHSPNTTSLWAAAQVSDGRLPMGVLSYSLRCQSMRSRHLCASFFTVHKVLQPGCPFAGRTTGATFGSANGMFCDVVGQPLPVYSQHQVFLCIDHPLRHLAKPASQSKGVTAGSGRDVVGQPLPVYSQHQVFLSIDHPLRQLAKPASQSKEITAGSCRDVVGQPLAVYSQHQAFLCIDHPFPQWAKPASQSKGITSGSGGREGCAPAGQPTR